MPRPRRATRAPTMSCSMPGCASRPRRWPVGVESAGTIRAGCWTGDAWVFELGWQPWAKKRPQISRGGRRTHQPPDDAAAEASTREALLNLFDRPPLTGNLELSLVFYRRSPQVVDPGTLIKQLC